jgi:prevent-host-death family protein
MDWPECGVAGDGTATNVAVRKYLSTRGVDDAAALYGLTIHLDHVSLAGMESIPVSKFKATCLAVLQRVKRTGRPVVITRFGQPVAEVVPPQQKASKSDWLGGMAGRVQITGDIVAPVLEPETWDALKQ